MTDSDRGALTPLAAMDLAAADRAIRQSAGTDLTEAKEAIVDGLIGLTLAHCTGAGEAGARLYGGKPSSLLVSGFLMPRFDQLGTDETSDIHIATMGLDAQIAADGTGAIIVEPQLAIYVRALPDWDEISDPRYDIMPQIQLSRTTRQAVEALARSFIAAEMAALPPLVDEEPDETSGDSAATADAAREAADIASEAAVGGDSEAQGNAQAAIQTADRADRTAAARAEQIARRRTARRSRADQIAAIRRAAFDRAFAQLGITLQPAAGSARPVTADDLQNPETSDPSSADDEPAGTDGETAGDEVGGGNLGGVDASTDVPPPAGGALGPLRPDSGRLANRHAAPQPIPQKWRRFDLALEPLALDITDDAARQRVAGGFGGSVAAAVDRVLGDWLASEDGQRHAHRTNETVLPSQFADRASWEAYLAGLRQRRPATLDDIRPLLDQVALVADIDPDFVDPTRRNVRIAIENGADQPTRATSAAFEHAVFQVSFAARFPAVAHRALRLDRVRPSYRFREWLEYPAMGLNCGVELASADTETVMLRTTWAPRYTQPRIEPVDIPGVPMRYDALASDTLALEALYALPDAYDRWIDAQHGVDAGAGLDPDLAAQEHRAHGEDVAAYARESRFIRQGIDLLIAARAAYVSLPAATGPARLLLERAAAPYRAWLLTNESFRRYGGTRYTGWRLFQLAFILAHVPTLASRMPEYADRFDPFRDELSASLLYFPTGGGKSEAFFGLLIFNLFLDRLRGKDRGVSALVRYPLRLLTLQQARRLMRILVQAELVRHGARVGTWPFEIGFWVGSGNTPNRVAQGFGGVPVVTAAAHANDHALLNPPDGTSSTAADARRRSNRYVEALQSYDKLRSCPVCGSATGMRKYRDQAGRIGIVCFNDADCAWNLAFPPAPTRMPLPFLLTDDTIYQRAPAVVLGTIDKLALIGQHDRTINAIAGMFGAARYIDRHNGHLLMPRSAKDLNAAEDAGLTRLRPAFLNGEIVFHDPFPSLIVQDEGHLLDESLGTFSGLFETVFERIQLRLGEGLLHDQVATWQPLGESTTRPRLAKVIAATATISDPDRQLRVLYQREPLRFPCPGPSLYESFYSAPREPLRPERLAYAASLPARLRPERSTPRMRTYVSIMTNGRSHTMTTSAVVSAYHLAFTRLWQQLESGNTAGVVQTLAAALPPEDPLSGLRAQALDELIGQRDLLATLLDLQRISLTYVTNKKGGDQVIETLQSQVDRDQRVAGVGELPFNTALISGGVTIAEIQDVMQRAEETGLPGQPFAPLDEALRNIVATSAISHGVDVDKFNAMFFAGLPTDIAEYIQASSRVGRSHVGFSWLVPTPHSRRDRYVVETHDQFHRFLERMIPPPAVQRWADRAIRRVMPSVVQAYLCAVVEQDLFRLAPDATKTSARTFTTAASILAWSNRLGRAASIEALRDFAVEAIGLAGRGAAAIGAAPHADYYREFVEREIRGILDVFTERSDSSALASYWQRRESANFRRPMTSLRDVDAGGIIIAAGRDPGRGGRRVHPETVRQVMRIIRGQRLVSRTDVDAEAAPIDQED
ncbi:DEAD/DEAH box helicase [Sphingomonas sp. PB4P5]|uniref:DEAD/DEAH box helicase n=1 Tax=Parasphingomonas puruogangriensis TaxID=3096155 RepID=UPI002FC74F9B